MMKMVELVIIEVIVVVKVEMLEEGISVMIVEVIWW